jgi:hypothetical protein
MSVSVSLDAMQDVETEDDVERLAQTVNVERVQAMVVDPGTQKLGDRPELGAGHEVDAEPPADPGNVLLLVHGHHAGGPATLGQEGVEPVERAHVEQARAGQVLGYRAQAIAVIPCDARCVEAGAVEANA